MHKVWELRRRWKVREGGHLFTRVNNRRLSDRRHSIHIFVVISPEASRVVSPLIDDYIEALFEAGLTCGGTGSTATDDTNP